MPKHRPPDAVTTLRESKAALLEAMTEVVKAPKPEPIRFQPERRSRVPFQVTLVAVLLIGVSLLIVRPVWLVGESTIIQTPKARRASAVLSVVEAMGRVKGYRARNGRLPAALPDAGVTNRDLRFTKTDHNEFEISVVENGEIIKLRSTDSLSAAFISSVRALKERK